MSWDIVWKHVDPLNGNDTTGDGSTGAPWKTLQHAIDIVKTYPNNGAGYGIKRMDRGTFEVMTGPINFGTLAGSSGKFIPLVAVGLSWERGNFYMRFDGNGTVNQCFSVIPTSDFIIIDGLYVRNYKYQVISVTNVMLSSWIWNRIIVEGASVFSYSWAYMSAHYFNDITMYNCVVTDYDGYMFAPNYSSVNRLRMIGCSSTFDLPLLRIPQYASFRNILLHDCTAKNYLTESYYGINSLKNFIIDGCQLTASGVVTLIRITGGLHLQNGCIANNVLPAATYRGIILTEGGTIRAEDLAFYGNGDAPKHATTAAGGDIYKSNFVDLPAQPFPNRGSDDFTMAEICQARRIAREIGGYNGIASFIDGETP